MRQALRTTLERYQEIVRDESRSNLSDQERHDLAAVRRWNLEHQAARSGVPMSIQERVYEFQREKQKVLQELHEDFARIARKEGSIEYFEAGIPVRYEEGRLFAYRNGEDVSLTIGQMVADLTWRVRYNLDPVTVPAVIQKRYTLEVARTKLWDLMQNQIAIHESADPNFPLEHSNGALHGIIKNERADGPHAEQPGFLAEKLLFSFLKQLEIDSRGLFKVARADAYEDVVQKVDLSVSVPSWLRGVKVETEREPRRKPSRLIKGFQLSLGSGLGRKRRQIFEVTQNPDLRQDFRDIALLVMGSGAVESAYASWVKDGRPPGGPYCYFSKDGAREILRLVLSDLLPTEELDHVSEFFYPKVARETFRPRLMIQNGIEQKDLPKSGKKAMEQEEKAKLLKETKSEIEAAIQLADSSAIHSRKVLSSLDQVVLLRDLILRGQRALEEMLQKRGAISAMYAGDIKAIEFLDTQWVSLEKRLKLIQRRLPFVELLLERMKRVDRFSPVEKERGLQALPFEWRERFQALKMSLEEGERVGLRERIEAARSQLFSYSQPVIDSLYAKLQARSEKRLPEQLEQLTAFMVLSRELETMRKQVDQIAAYKK